jgi:hypothetical protein
VNDDLAFVQVSDCLNRVFVAFAGGCIPFAVIHPTRVESACWYELADTMLLMSVVPCLFVILGARFQLLLDVHAQLHHDDVVGNAELVVGNAELVVGNAELVESVDDSVEKTVRAFGNSSLTVVFEIPRCR